MVAFADGIETSNSTYEYELPVDVEGRNHTANSNAVILSVLNAVGVDVRTIATVVSNPYAQRLNKFL